MDSFWDSLFRYAEPLVQPYFDEHALLSRLAVLATIVSLLGSPAIYFVKRLYDESTQRHRISRNLYGELKDALDALNGKKGHKFKELTIDNKTIYYLVAFFNHDVYDSLVNSGKINFLSHELQQEMQDIFQMMKRHNHYLELIDELTDKADLEKQDIRNITDKYYIILDEYEQDMLKKIPDMMKKLEERFDVKPLKSN